MAIGKMAKNSLVFIIIALSLMPSSCVEPIVMDPEEDMPVVVHCVLTRDLDAERTSPDQTPVQQLDLFYAKRIADTGDYKSISDAEVTVYGGGQGHSFAWNGEKWTSSFTPEFGTEYFLTVCLKNGQTISSKTVFPTKVDIISEATYFPSVSRYYRILNCDTDIDIWMTAIKGREYDVKYFCTNHPGADISNLGDKALMDLPVFDQLVSNMHSILKNDQYADRELFNNFLDCCAYLPSHSQFLRIHHPKDFDNGIDKPLLLQYNYSNNSYDYKHCRDGFILFTDTVSVIERMVGGDPYYLPICIYVMSPAYDKHLGFLVKNSLHQDELANLYSIDLSYTNIEGGLGIFGSMYYWNYLR